MYPPPGRVAVESERVRAGSVFGDYLGHSDVIANNRVLTRMKAVVADGVRALVGSANLTGKGLGANVEVGVH